MRRIICEDCKKSYDYSKDEFCPRCGAFNPPVRTWGMDSQGNVIRVDGVNERDHAGSFAHREVHKEKDIRKATGMDWNSKKKVSTPQSVPPSPSPALQPPRYRSAQKQNFSDRFKTFLWILAIILLFNLILPILIALL